MARRLSDILVILFLSCILVLGQVAEQPKYGPAKNPIAIPLSHDYSYFSDKASKGSDFWSLIPFYVPQFNDYSCSTASVAMVMNGILMAGKALRNSDKNITQADLLEKIRANHWKERVSNKGYMGHHGLTLSQLAEAIKESLKGYGINNYSVLEIPTNNYSEAGLQKFRDVLHRNESNNKNFLLVHFVQDDLTKASGGPFAHICPVGAYDSAKRKVLILDVDRDWYEPYWISDDQLFRAMIHKTDMFGFGGYIFIDEIKKS